MANLGLVLTQGCSHDLERYHDFVVEINYFLNTWFLLQNHDNALNQDNDFQWKQALTHGHHSIVKLQIGTQYKIILYTKQFRTILWSLSESNKHCCCESGALSPFVGDFLNGILYQAVPKTAFGNLPLRNPFRNTYVLYSHVYFFFVIESWIFIPRNTLLNAYHRHSRLTRNIWA